jgi:chitin synthase
MHNDPDIMGLCGETRIANKNQSWVTMIQVYEYFISHHMAKSFESMFGGVTCLPGCFCMWRFKGRPKNDTWDRMAGGSADVWVPLLTSQDVIQEYNQSVVVSCYLVVKLLFSF